MDRKQNQQKQQKQQSLKLPVALVLMEFVLLALATALVFGIAGVEVKNRAVSFSLSSDPMSYVMLSLSIVLFIAIYFSLKKRNPEFFERQKLVSKDMKQMVKFEFKRAKSDPRVPALMLIQFAFVFALAVAIAAYLDSEWELINWSARGIQEPVKTALNVLLFATAAGAFFLLYRYTLEFRKS